MGQQRGVHPCGESGVLSRQAWRIVGITAITVFGLLVAAILLIVGIILYAVSCPPNTIAGHKCAEGVVRVYNGSDEPVVFVIMVEGEEPSEVGPLLRSRDHLAYVGPGGCLAAPVEVRSAEGELLGELEAACEGSELVWEGPDQS